MINEPHNEFDQKSAKDTNGMSNIEIKQGLEQPPMKRERVSHWGQGYELNNGRFAIKKVLGEGGFGVTYLAEDRNINNRLVVIKTLNEKVQKGDQDLFHKLQQDFQNEAKRLSECNHRNIVTIYDRFAEEKTGLECIVMEYIPGKTLKDRVGDLDFRGAYMEEEEALGYIHQIAEALEVIHRQNLVHRDVKPGNIMIRKGTREVVLIDFGIAREFNNEDRIQTAYVSQNYAPLEQYQQLERKGPFTDIYALGATLYFLLTKKAPENARDRADSLSMHDRDPLKPPKEINRKISDRTNNAIIKALELAPKKRPQNIGEFLSLLGLGPV
ncbi:MAG: serine/threonine protein kinase, partial [Okeania sp. SIO2H7]|nr:serine/threonine protein kinase [Okeania sp. SIO2H7]